MDTTQVLIQCADDAKSKCNWVQHFVNKQIVIGNRQLPLARCRKRRVRVVASDYRRRALIVQRLWYENSSRSGRNSVKSTADVDLRRPPQEGKALLVFWVFRSEYKNCLFSYWTIFYDSNLDSVWIVLF